MQAGTSISDRGTVTILALAHRQRPVGVDLAASRAYAYGNYQDHFGGALAHNQDLARYAQSILLEKFIAANQLRWGELKCGATAADG